MSEQQYRWYIVHTSSGAEKRVRQSILENAAKKDLSDKFLEIVIPAVEVSKMQRGKEVKVDKKIIPGYVLIQMILNDETWHLVKDIPQVTNFLGGSSKPYPVPDHEVTNVLNQIKLKAKDAHDIKNYEIGQVVEIIDGPFESFSGVIDDVDVEKLRLKVSVSIFGRATPIDLNFSQVQKSDGL
jgi:transcriptional antiterminator NusG